MSRTRVVMVIAIVIFCLTGGVGYFVWASSDYSTSIVRLPYSQLPNSLTQTPGSDSTSAVDVSDRAAKYGGTGPALLYVSRGTDHFGKLVVVPDGGRPIPVDRSCDRVHASRETVSCLSADTARPGIANITELDRGFGVRREVSLLGRPSRTRVSPDGKRIAITNFITGHSYNGEPGSFSTETAIIETPTYVRQLENFEVTRDGKRFMPVDRNLWGVTFAKDSNELYVTMKSAQTTYLLRGDIKLNKLTVVEENVECPSLSPDATKIAFKQKVDGGWKAAVLDLATNKRTVLRSGLIDDQIEWLDTDTIVYGQSRISERGGRTADIWSLDIVDSAKPNVLVENGESPAVIR